MWNGLAAILLTLAASAAGEGPALAPWGESAEAHFMTRQERRSWESLVSEEDRERFVAAFRERHDPDFVEEVRRRADVVDERLPLGLTKTSLTTRGRIVMLLGAPAELSMRAFGAPMPGNMGHPLDSRKGGATDHVRIAPSLIAGAGGRVEYTLRYAPNPALGIGPEGWTLVIEADAVSGKDRPKRRRDTKRIEAILDAAAATALRKR